MTLYQNIAEKIQRSIESGVYGPGDRLPSVRELSFTVHASVSTILQAYRVLESRGLLEARPQSGYYVLPAHRRQLRDGDPPYIGEEYFQKPTDVTVSKHMMEMLAVAQDEKYIHLGLAQPASEALPLEHLSRLIKRLSKHSSSAITGYDNPQGNVDLRIQIARHLLARNCDVTPDDIIITNGCQEALSLCLMTTCSKGDVVAVESPAYPGMLHAIQQFGMRVLEIPSNPETGISLEALSMAIEQWPVRACYVTPNVQNPQGSSLPDRNKKDLVNLLSRSDIMLIEDDTNGDLAFEKDRGRLAKYYDSTNSVLLCSSFSKTVAPGFRVGWVIPGRFKEQMVKLKYVLNLGGSELYQLVIAEYLASGRYERDIRRIRRSHLHSLTNLRETVLEEFPTGTKCSQPKGGFLIWIELPRDIDSIKLSQAAMQENIVVAPGTIFSANNKFHNYIRLGSGGEWTRRIAQATKRVGQLAHDQI